jgi:hypothetical protein
MRFLIHAQLCRAILANFGSRTTALGEAVVKRIKNMVNSAYGREVVVLNSRKTTIANHMEKANYYGKITIGKEIHNVLIEVS